jgi:hypothetical protein
LTARTLSLAQGKLLWKKMFQRKGGEARRRAFSALEQNARSNVSN